MTTTTAVDQPTSHKTGQTLIMGGFRWGVGDDLATAKKNFRRFGGRLSGGYAVIVFDAEASFEGVDQMGRYHYIGKAPTVTEVQPRR
jgi:hypothetical protein